MCYAVKRPKIEPDENETWYSVCECCAWQGDESYLEINDCETTCPECGNHDLEVRKE